MEQLTIARQNALEGDDNALKEFIRGLSDIDLRSYTPDK